MQKADFLEELQIRAKEQQQLRQGILFPRLFHFIAINLGNHPWKPLIPLSVIASCLFYFLFGKQYIDFVLSLFKAL